MDWNMEMRPFKNANPYDMQHYGFIRYTHDKNNPSSIADDIIYAITQDKIQVKYG